MISEAEARRLWESEMGKHLPDQDWDNLKSLYLGVLRGELATDPDSPLEFDTPSQALEELHAADARARLTWPLDPNWSSPVSPPASWKRHSSWVLQSSILNRMMRRGRTALGLEKPLTPQELTPYLERRASLQTWPKTPCNVHQIELPRLSGDGRVTGFATIRAYESDTKSGLYLAFGLVKLLETSLGLPTAPGLLYLCTDVPVELPWIQASTAGGPVHMVIPTYEVPPEEVATAYARARSSASEPTRASLHTLIASYRRAAGSGEELVAFCEPLRAQRFSWNEIAEKWNTEHGERTFSSGDGLSRVYRRTKDHVSANGGPS